MRSYGITNAAPYASAPAVGAAGDTYYNTATKTLYLSDGTTWIAVTAGAGATTGQISGSIALTNRNNTTASTWLDWGSISSIPLASIPVGTTNATIIGLVTGFATDFTSTGTNPINVRLGISFDGGATWSYSTQVDTGPIGQISPTFPNRTSFANSCQWTQAAATTGQVQIKAQVQSGATANNVTFNAGELTWFIPLGVKGDKGDNVVSDLAKWNVAWGAVAWGSGVPDGTNVPNGNTTLVSSIINFTPLSGRRYLIHYTTRATWVSAGNTFNFDLYNGGSRDTTVTPPVEQYIASERPYQGFNGEWALSGDGVARSWRVMAAGGVTFSVYVGLFWVEDIGPVVQASNTPPQGITPVVAAGNALGIVALGVGIDGVTASGGNITFTNNLTFTFLAGRRYRVVAEIRAFTVNSAARAFIFDVGANAPWGVGPYERWMVSSPTFNYSGRHFSVLMPGDGVTRTISIRGDNAQGTFYCPEFYIEDLGPTTVPAYPIPLDTSPWNAFTPVMRNGSTLATITAEGRMFRVGRMITVHYAIKFISVAAGQYNIQLPATARVPDPGVWNNYWADSIGVAGYVTQGGSHYKGIASIQDGNQFYIANFAYPVQAWSNSYPVAAAVNDIIYATITYEATQ